MKSNELRKGDRVLLKNGWFAWIEDNKKGNIRMATVEGFSTETGSIYAWDIKGKVATDKPALEEIELTQAQIKGQKAMEAWGF